MDQPSAHTMYSGFDPEDFHIDPAIMEKVLDGKKLKKVAFLSGARREYYPEKPGHSKFALVHTDHVDPHIPPYRMYNPPDNDRLNKPISTKGYGIGGLSAPRFARNIKDKHPGPAKYQEGFRKKVGRQNYFPPRVWMNFGLVKKDEGVRQLRNEDTRNRLNNMWGKCQQVRVGFETTAKQPRFGKVKRFNCVGPGHYALTEYTAPKISINNGFLRGPVTFNSSTKLHCSYGPKDCCVECGMTLMSSMDYYRSIKPITLNGSTMSASYYRQQFFRRSEDIAPDEIKIAGETTETTTEKPRLGRKRRVLLCRPCFCKAMRGESKYWKKKKEVQEVFEKTRHCSFTHEHNGFPEYTEKASCLWTRNLRRKEATLTLHWPDKCDRRMVQRKSKI